MTESAVPPRRTKFRRCLVFLAKAEGLGAVLGAMITVAGAFLFWSFVEKDLKNRELAAEARDKRNQLAFSVSREASEVVARTFWNGQNAILSLSPDLLARADEQTWQGRAQVDQIVEARLAFAEAGKNWRIASGTWALLMEFFDPTADAIPKSRWETLNEQMELYLECVESAAHGEYLDCLKRQSSPEFILPAELECDCSHLRRRIDRALEDWSKSLREGAGL